MTIFVVGLLAFLVVHSTGLFAPRWRQAQRQKLGEGRWKALYSLASLASLGLIIWGFSIARTDPVVLWVPPRGIRHMVIAGMLPVFVLLAASGGKGHIRQWVGHPMSLAIAIWALLHLLADGRLVPTMLFAGFLAWAAILVFVRRARDRNADVQYRAAGFAPDALALVAGTLVWALFLFFGHEWLIGVRPLG